MLDQAVHKKLNTVLIVVTIALGVCIGGLAGLLYARDTVYDYTLTVPGGSGNPIELQYGTWPELANTNFFQSVHDDFMSKKVSFVEANLTTMNLRVFRDGAEALSVPIKSKGKEGSWWETPSGLYRAEGKERNHFSSFGKVYMPWSIPFQGNFFIHGWPYHADGTPVPEGYSGGCIRLEDQYAEQVYALVDTGMPILVYEEQAPTTMSYTLNTPPIGAKSSLVADVDSNFVLSAGNTSADHTTGLLGNVLTALVASEHKNIEQTVTVRADLIDGLPQGRLQVDTSYSLYDLFFPLLMENSHEAAQVIAGNFGARRFVNMLNAKARAIGMQHTTIHDVGSDRDETTAEDLFLFVKYLHSNRPFVLAMSGGHANTRTYGEPLFTDIVPVHPMSGDEAFVGGATDEQRLYTTAQNNESNESAAIAMVFASSSAASTGGVHDLVTVLRLTFGGSERDVAFIVLGSDDPEQDTRRLLAFTRELYR